MISLLSESPSVLASATRRFRLLAPVIDSSDATQRDYWAYRLSVSPTELERRDSKRSARRLPRRAATPRQITRTDRPSPSRSPERLQGESPAGEDGASRKQSIGETARLYNRPRPESFRSVVRIRVLHGFVVDVALMDHLGLASLERSNALEDLGLFRWARNRADLLRTGDGTHGWLDLQQEGPANCAPRFQLPRSPHVQSSRGRQADLAP